MATAGLSALGLLTPRSAFAGLQFKACNAKEIRARTGCVVDTSRAFASVNAGSFLALPAAAKIPERARVAARSELEKVADRTAQHFGVEGFKNLKDEKMNRAALAQHAGYVAGELSRQFGVDVETGHRLVLKHYGKQGARISDLAHDLAKHGRTGVREFVEKEDNGWMFGAWGFGDVDKALNRVGVYAGEATFAFAEALTGSRSAAEKLVKEVASSSPEELQRMLQEPWDGPGLVAQFGARAAQTGWVASKFGQGVVEAHDPKKAERAANRWNAELMTDFDTMATQKGWPEVAKDLDQLKSYVRQRQSERTRLFED